MNTNRDVQAFLRQLEDERQLSPNTVVAYRKDLRDLGDFLDDYLGGPAWSWTDVDRLTLRGFLGWCHRKGLSRRTSARKLSAVRSLFRFLHAEGLSPRNPTRAVRAPKLEKRLPGHLSRAEVESVFRLAQARADENTFLGTRNLAILELLYGSGIRLADAPRVSALASASGSISTSALAATPDRTPRSCGSACAAEGSRRSAHAWTCGP